MEVAETANILSAKIIIFIQERMTKISVTFNDLKYARVISPSYTNLIYRSDSYIKTERSRIIQ